MRYLKFQLSNVVLERFISSEMRDSRASMPEQWAGTEKRGKRSHRLNSEMRE